MDLNLQIAYPDNLPDALLETREEFEKEAKMALFFIDSNQYHQGTKSPCGQGRPLLAVVSCFPRLFLRMMRNDEESSWVHT